MIILKMEQKISYFQQLKTVKHLLNKLTQNHKKGYNSNSANQEKPSISNNLYRSKDFGLKD